MSISVRRLAAKAAFAISALAITTGVQASSYTQSFTNVTFYYSGFSTFNGASSDGAAHTYFSDGVAFADGVAEQGALLRMTGQLNYELVLDAESGGRCDMAMLWFGWVVGPASGEPHGPPEPRFCDATVQTLARNMVIDTGYIELAEGPTSAYLVDMTVLSFSSPAPEPSTYALLLAGLGVVGLGARVRRRD
jgi:hypothetical protein